jgi:glycerol-3-phosphate dehydrogenase (NAD(P)+)
VAAEIRSGTNSRYLPGIVLPDLAATADLDAALDGARVVVLAVPCRAVRSLCETLARRDPAPPVVVCAAKGLERESGLRMSEVLAQALPPRCRPLVLLGPSHAEEVALRMPTAVVLGGGSGAEAALVQEALSTPWLRIYTNDDLPGVEYAGALKNVLAIAAGICDGLGLGDNTKGALLTRGLAEIARLGSSLGARRETFFGLAGVGDVITTCLSRHSRNRALGERVGRGESFAAALEAIGQVVEGAETVRTVSRLAQRHGIPVPISEQVEQVLFAGRDPHAAIDELMGRALRSEEEGGGPGNGEVPRPGRGDEHER